MAHFEQNGSIWAIFWAIFRVRFCYFDDVLKILILIKSGYLIFNKNIFGIPKRNPQNQCKDSSINYQLLNM